MMEKVLKRWGGKNIGLSVVESDEPIKKNSIFGMFKKTPEQIAKDRAVRSVYEEERHKARLERAKTDAREAVMHPKPNPVISIGAAIMKGLMPPPKQQPQQKIKYIYAGKKHKGKRQKRQKQRVVMQPRPQVVQNPFMPPQPPSQQQPFRIF
jgi:hypothetical protein